MKQTGQIRKKQKYVRFSILYSLAYVLQPTHAIPFNLSSVISMTTAMMMIKWTIKVMFDELVHCTSTSSYTLV